MSYSEFLKGYTAEEIKARREAGIVERDLAQEAKDKAERERNLNFMRSVKSSSAAMEKLEKKAWRQFHKRK